MTRTFQVLYAIIFNANQFIHMCGIFFYFYIVYLRLCGKVIASPRNCQVDIYI